jgi:putative PIN family toxin of toxin-antitoxin system
MKTASATELKVVLDTNVYISAFTHPQGPLLKIWQRARKRHFHSFISPAIIGEVARVLREDFMWPEEAITARLKVLASTSEIVVPKDRLQAVVDDPDDHHILECAVEADADLIVSGDQHLRRLKLFQGIGIVTPINFLRTLGEK